MGHRSGTMSPTIWLRIPALLAASVLVWQPAFGQGNSAPPARTGGGSTAPGGGTPSPGGAGNTNPGRVPTQGPNQNPNNTQPGQTITQPIFLSGRVMVDDGTPPPSRVAIQRLCGTTPRIEGYNDSRGYFSIQLGANTSEALQDASTSGFPDFGDPAGASNSRLGGLGG